MEKNIKLDHNTWLQPKWMKTSNVKKDQTVKVLEEMGEFL